MMKVIFSGMLCSVLFLGSAEAGGEETGMMKPARGSVYAFLLEGLKLLADGDVESWIAGYCDGLRLCKNEAELAMIRNYRAPLQEKIAPTCLKDGERALDIARVIGDPEVDIAVKIYLVCDPQVPPRFYSLRKTADYWFFISL